MRRRMLSALAAGLAVALLGSGAYADGPGRDRDGLTSAQRAVLHGIASDTWRFYRTDVDPNTHLPLDNIGPNGKRGTYTSAANIGVYLWAVVAAHDLGLIGRREATSDIAATLTEVGTLARDNGFLHQWYDTTTGHVIRNPGDIDCATEPAPVFDNCYFISNVDNGWYASGLVVARSALPELRHLVDGLMDPMSFGLFYDGRPQTACNVNPAIAGNQPTGQMFGGYYVGLPVDQGLNWQHYYHNGAFYSDPRISAYVGMGLHQMPGDVWWRSWRELPPQQCATDPDFSWQGQWPMAGHWQVYADPQSGRQFNVWEGRYTYPGSDLTFIPTFAGGMFEGLMANLVVPETTWGTRTFGLADQRLAQVQMKYATEALHLPVWGLSPSSTPDDTGGYGGFGVEGLLFPYHGLGADASHPSSGLSQCNGCATEDTVTPHASVIALDVLPRQAYANIQALRQLYPDIYRTDGGFFDSVNPTTKQVGHRDLVLDQSMIMAALDNALNDRAMQRHFAEDPVSSMARLYLGAERFSI
jgi:Putative glucoamylase